MSKFILCCPKCGEKEYLKHRGNTFTCTECDDEFDLDEMDFEMEDN